MICSPSCVGKLNRLILHSVRICYEDIIHRGPHGKSDAKASCLRHRRKCQSCGEMKKSFSIIHCSCSLYRHLVEGESRYCKSVPCNITELPSPLALCHCRERNARLNAIQLLFSEVREAGILSQSQRDAEMLINSCDFDSGCLLLQKLNVENLNEVHAWPELSRNKTG